MNICHFHLGDRLSGVGSYLKAFSCCEHFSYFIADCNKQDHKKSNQFRIMKSSLLGFFVFDLYRFYKFLKINNIRYIHVHTLRALFLILIVKVISFGRIKLFYTGHGIRFDQKNSYLSKLLFKQIEKTLLSQVSEIIYIRKHDFILGTNTFGCKNKSHLINTRISSGHITRKSQFSKNLEVVSIGSLIEIKDPFLFISIASKVIQKIPDVTFTWIGDGHLFNQCLERVKILNLSTNIKFVGYKERQEVLSYLAEKASLYLCTSKLETYPMVFLEAMSFGVPVCSKNLKGLENEFEGLVTYCETHNIDDEIVNFLQHLQDLDRLSDRVFQASKQYFVDITKMKEEYENIYDKYKT